MINLFDFHLFLAILFLFGQIEFFQIILPQEDNNLEKILLDQTGRILLKTNENQIDLSNFSAGYFFLQIPQVSQKLWKILKN